MRLMLGTAGRAHAHNPCMRAQPKTFGYHEVFHACTILASICHFAAVYIMIQQNPEKLLHSR